LLKFIKLLIVFSFNLISSFIKFLIFSLVKTQNTRQKTWLTLLLSSVIISIRNYQNKIKYIFNIKMNYFQEFKVLSYELNLTPKLHFECHVLFEWTVVRNFIFFSFKDLFDCFTCFWKRNHRSTPFPLWRHQDLTAIKFVHCDGQHLRIQSKFNFTNHCLMVNSHKNLNSFFNSEIYIYFLEQVYQ
jgi:hypothetical protein